MELRNSVIQLEISGKILIIGIGQGEDKISGLEDEVEVFDHKSKEHEINKTNKQNKMQQMNMQELWDTKQGQSLQIINIDTNASPMAQSGHSTDSQKNLLRINKIKNLLIYPKLRNIVTIQIQETHKTPNGQQQRRIAPQIIIVKTLNTENKQGFF